MDFYLTNNATGDMLHIPLLPDKLKVSGGDANVISMNIISLGEIRLPRGVKVTSYQWEGKFPGENMRFYRQVKDWKTPLTLKAWLEQCRDNAVKLRFMATDIGINDDVYIEKFTGDFSGGNGDYAYSITLQRWRSVHVITTSEAGVETDTLSRLISAHYVAIRPASVLEKYLTHVVVAGDTLYSIAARYLGSGQKQEDIYQLNKEMMDAANRGKKVEKYKVYIGQVLLVKLKPVPPAPSTPPTPSTSTSGSGGGGRTRTKKKTKLNPDIKHKEPNRTASQVNAKLAASIKKIKGYNK